MAAPSNSTVQSSPAARSTDRSSGDRHLVSAVPIAYDDLRRVALREGVVGLYWRGVRRLAGERGFQIQRVVALTARDGVEPEPDPAAVRRRRDRRRQLPPVPECPHLVGAVRFGKHEMVSGLGIGACGGPAFEEGDPFGGPGAPHRHAGHVLEPLGAQVLKDEVALGPHRVEVPQVDARRYEGRHVLAFEQPEHRPDVKLEHGWSLLCRHRASSADVERQVAKSSSSHRGRRVPRMRPWGGRDGGHPVPVPALDRLLPRQFGAANGYPGVLTSPTVITGQPHIPIGPTIDQLRFAARPRPVSLRTDQANYRSSVTKPRPPAAWNARITPWASLFLVRRPSGSPEERPRVEVVTPATDLAIGDREHRDVPVGVGSSGRDDAAL